MSHCSIFFGNYLKGPRVFRWRDHTSLQHHFNLFLDLISLWVWYTIGPLPNWSLIPLLVPNWPSSAWIVWETAKVLPDCSLKSLETSVMSVPDSYFGLQLYYRMQLFRWLLVCLLKWFKTFPYPKIFQRLSTSARPSLIACRVPLPCCWGSPQGME